MKKIIFLSYTILSLFLLCSCVAVNKGLNEKIAIDALKSNYETLDIKESLHIENLSSGSIIFYEASDGLRHSYFKKLGRNWGLKGMSGNVQIDPEKMLSYGMENNAKENLLIYYGAVKNQDISQILVKQNDQEGNAKIVQTSANYRIWFVTFQRFKEPEKGRADVLKIECYSGKNLVFTEGYNYLD